MGGLAFVEVTSSIPVLSFTFKSPSVSHKHKHHYTSRPRKYIIDKTSNLGSFHFITRPKHSHPHHLAMASSSSDQSSNTESESQSQSQPSMIGGHAKVRFSTINQHPSSNITPHSFSHPHPPSFTLQPQNGQKHTD